MWRPGKTTYISSYSVHTIRKNILLEGALMKPFNKRNKRLYISTIIGAIFVSAAGTLLHFVYGWTGNHFIVGPVSYTHLDVYKRQLPCRLSL